MAILVISSVLIVVFNLIADLVYAALDPRVSYR
jgi:ABC-type dipeptide/oligopeptide/nickel transport system permease component